MKWMPKHHDKREWHRVFAFLPHRLITGQKAWLEIILRRKVGETGCCGVCGVGSSPIYEYGCKHGTKMEEAP